MDELENRRVGVYFLYEKENLVYIGRSKNVNKRLKTHSVSYDRFEVIDCQLEDLSRIEKENIIKYKPPKNRMFVLPKGVQRYSDRGGFMPVTFCLGDGLKRSLKKEAAKEGRSLAGHIRWIIENRKVKK